MVTIELVPYEQDEFAETTMGRVATGKKLTINLAFFLGPFLKPFLAKEQGLDGLSKGQRIGQALETARKSNVLELDEIDYEYVKNKIDKEITADVGLDQNLSPEITKFVEAGKEKTAVDADPLPVETLEPKPEKK